MATFIIQNAFNLQSANGKLMLPGSYVTPDTPEQEAELTSFCADGSCKLIPSTPPPKPADPMADEQTAADTTDTSEDTPLDPSDDMSVVPGVGQKTEAKLKTANITTLSQLKAAVLDPAQADALKELLGTSYDKILAYFQAN